MTAWAQPHCGHSCNKKNIFNIIFLPSWQMTGHFFKQGAQIELVPKAGG